jgi:cytosine deaminase
MASEAGVTRLRTHVNWWQPDACSSAWRVIGEIARERRGHLEIERVALMPLRWFSDPEQARRVLSLVADGNGAVLAGSFVHTSTWNEEALRNLIVGADHAAIDVDLHVDEEIDARACGSRRAAEICSAIGFGGSLTLSHACVLAAQPAEIAMATLDVIARGRITMVALPMTNLLLQDEAHGRTPRVRGITLVHEARQRGIPVLFDSDSVQDAFCGLGALDPVETMLLAAAAAQLRRPFDEWSDALCDGLGRPLAGRVADLIVFPDANAVCWPSRGWRRIAIRAGRLLAAQEGRLGGGSAGSGLPG